MSLQSSATASAATALSTRPSTGIVWGLLGVLAFSFTLPLTRIAVGGLSPMFIGSGRAVLAASLAAAALAWTRQRRPDARQWRRLAVVAGGIVLGFPMLTSYALQTASASHAAVVIALLPAATAVMAVVRGHERPPAAFWVASGLGAVAAVGFAFLRGAGIGAVHWSDLLLFTAVVLCAIGYAEGGLLSRELGAWQTISWALVLSAPLMLVLAVISWTTSPPHASATQWLAFAYLGVVSMFLGFVAWYRGLGIGPIARVSQVQLVQPVLSILWAGLLVGEHLTWTTFVGGLVVIACAGSAVRARSRAAR